MSSRQLLITAALAVLAACGPPGAYDGGSGGGGGGSGGGTGGTGGTGGSGGSGGSGGTGGTGGGSSDPCAYDAGTTFTPQLVVRAHDGGSLPSPLYTRDRIEVRVEGLPPCSEVALDFSMDGGFTSGARFLANGSGTVSTASTAPLSGTWSGSDLDGLYWSMSNGGVAVGPGNDTAVVARWDGGAPLTTLIPRTMLPPGTTITSFREATATGLYADFYRPPGAGPFPGVVVVGGSEGGLGGGIITGQALVRDGFAVLAVAYWSVPGKPSGMTRIPLETFQRAMQRLRAMPDVKPAKLGLVGVSRGGEGVLLAGSAFSADIQAVVSLVGGGYAWASPGSSTVSTWTLDGGDVPFVPWPTGSNQVITRDAGYTVSFSTPFFQGGLNAAGPSVRAAAEIPVERIAGPVMLLASGDDGIWPSCPQSAVAWGRLGDAGHAAAYADQYVCFPSSGHGINPSRAGIPLADIIDRGTTNPRTGYGGSAKADSDVDHVITWSIAAFLSAALQ